MLPSGTYNVRYEQSMAIIRTRAQWAMFIVFLIALFTLPLYASRYVLSLISTMGITLIMVQGLGMLTGYGGLLSVGQAAFVGVGSYSCVILIERFEVPFLIAVLCAGLSSGLVGTIFGLAVLRIKGFYLAMTTLAAQFILVWCFLHMRSWTGGTEGLFVEPATIGGITFSSPQAKCYLILVFVVIMIYFAKNLMRTKLGRALVAIRDNDLAAAVMGINVPAYKLIVFFICCFYAGVAGSLYAHYVGFVSPVQFTLEDSILYVGMLIVGGMGSIMGAIFGTVFMRLLNESAIYLAPIVAEMFPRFGSEIFASLSTASYAVVIILFLVFEPKGINHRWKILKNQYRLYPSAY